MNILFIGDIFASPGRSLVADICRKSFQPEKIQFAMANAENSAGGFGITPLIAEELFSMGLDVLTSGNHIWDKKEIFDYLPRTPRLLRPANYPAELPGSGPGGDQSAAMAWWPRLSICRDARTCRQRTDPFRKADRILASIARSRGQSPHCRFSRGS